MSRARLTIWTVVLGGVATAGLALWPAPPASGAWEGGRPVRRPVPRAGFQQPAPGTLGQLVRALGDSPSPPPGAEASDSAPGREAQVEGVAKLIARLEELERRSLAGFHQQAGPVLEAFALSAPPARVEGKEDLLATALLAAIDGVPRSARVRGALLATLGGVGAVPELLARMPPEGPAAPVGPGGEERRGALLGLAWVAPRAGAAGGGGAAMPQGEAALELDPLVFLRHQPRGGLEPFPILFSRMPADGVAAFLRQEVLRPTDSMDDLFTRDLAVFALGVGVDHSSATLALFHTILQDRSRGMQRLRGSVCYVLARARGAEARGVLRAFLDDPDTGGLGKTVARWWMSAGPSLAGDVDSLMAPLLDLRSNVTDRVMAAGSLLRRLEVASKEELVQIEDVLAWRVMEESDPTSRLAAVVTLALAPGGVARMGALQHVLRTDESPTCRGWAAVGLGRTTTPLDEEAAAMLRAARQVERDPSVLEDIAKALGKQA